jgi:dimethylargininase
MRVFDFDNAIVRTPARSVVNGLSAAGQRPDYDGVVREHEAYVRALRDTGVQVEVLPRLHDFPDSVFVEDAALVFHGAAIVLRPGAPSRAGEAAEMAPVLERRFQRVLHLTEGFVDGGDVLTAPDTVFVGLSSRTNAEGAKALVALLRDVGLNGQAVATPKNVLHLKSDCALLDEETVLVTARLAASRVFKSFRQLIVPEGEEGAANALRINDGVFLSLGYPETADMLARANYRIVPLATREIARIDAGLSCMSLRWRA